MNLTWRTLHHLWHDIYRSCQFILLICNIWEFGPQIFEWLQGAINLPWFSCYITTYYRKKEGEITFRSWLLMTNNTDGGLAFLFLSYYQFFISSFKCFFSREDKIVERWGSITHALITVTHPILIPLSKIRLFLAFYL